MTKSWRNQLALIRFFLPFIIYRFHREYWVLIIRLSNKGSGMFFWVLLVELGGLVELRLDKALVSETIHKGFLNPQTKCKLFFLLCVQNKSLRRGTALTEFSFFTNRATWTWRGIKKYYQCYFLYWFVCPKCCTWPEKVWQKDSALKETNFTPFSPPACLDGQSTIEHLRIYSKRIFQPRTLLIWMSQKSLQNQMRIVSITPKATPNAERIERSANSIGTPSGQPGSSKPERNCLPSSSATDNCNFFKFLF